MADIFDKINNHPSHALVQINITLSNFQENKVVTMDLFNLEDDIKQLKLVLCKNYEINLALILLKAVENYKRT